MLCSVPAGKSGSNWLDRLRSTKGFPMGPDLGIDHFLSAPNSSISEPAQPVQRRAAHQTPAGGEDPGKEWYGIMTNVLSELFHMGDPDPLPAKKSSRKQANPRFLPSSAGGADDCLRKDDNALSFNSDNNLVEKAADLGCPDEDDEEEEEELKGYSRSEVTVIDTSCSGWKFEKVLYRRKNVWKVRDRKGKGRSGVGRKKKKRASCSGGDETVHGKKKLRLLHSAFGSSNVDATPSGKREVYKNITAHNLDQGPKMRFPISGSPTKLRNGSSSVVLIKGIPSAKKKKASIPKSSIKQ